ncbi:unnamed protein product [Discula destructiva]
MTPRVRREPWKTMESAGYGTNAGAPRKGLDRVLSVFNSKRTPPRRESRTHSLQSNRPPQDGSQLRQQLPDKQYDAFREPTIREPAIELDGGWGKDRAAAPFGAEVGHQPGPFGAAHRQLDAHGPVPPHKPVLKSEPDASWDAHYRPQDSPPAPSIPSLEMNHMVITTNAPPAAWHRKRTGPPPPLTIEPPGMYSQSPSDAVSAYSTYATPHSSYTYSSIHVPEVPPLPSPIPVEHYGQQFSYGGSHSARSSDSDGSSRLLHQYPPSPQSPGSTPSMSRSDSAAQESFPLPPPTPTYSQPQHHAPARIPEDAHFECLGPLPANIPIPSPPHFRTAHQQQSKDPFLTPRTRSPEDRSPITAKGSNSTMASAFSARANETGSEAVGFVQDPLLHETNPFRPHHQSPTHATFLSASAQEGGNDTTTSRSSRTPRRRESTDSLGSNFTVEEEARIQAQIVKNLDALDKERVMGEEDIVHIPQISERRYSWEE